MKVNTNKIPLSEQYQIIHQAEQNKLKLSDLLAQKGLSYDSLSYEENPELDDDCLRPIETLDNIQKSTDNIPAVSFFSGAGGFDIGFSYAGFNNIISVEFNEIFCNT